MSPLEIISAIAFSVVGVVVLMLLLVSCGYALLAPDEEHEAIAQAKVWRDKRRELNESERARSLR